MIPYKEVFNLNISADKGAIAAIGAVVAPWINALYGEGRTSFIWALICVIALDWITGIAAAQKDKTYASHYGLLVGIPRTLFLLAFPLLANVFDAALGTPGLLFYAVTFGLIYHTWQSLTANAYRAGWEKYIPDFVVKMVDSELKAKADRAAKRSVEGGDKDADA